MGVGGGGKMGGGCMIKCVQGYFAHKKPHPPRTLQYDHSWGPMVALGGELFLMSEVPL